MSSELTGLEIIECAKINLENVEKMNPQLSQHPIFKMALEQLNNGIKKIDAEENDS